MMLAVTVTHEGIDEEEDEYQVNDAKPTTPLRGCSTPLARRTSTCNNNPMNRIIIDTTEEFNPNNNNNNKSPQERCNTSSCSSGDEEGETLTGETEVPIVPSSRFHTPTKKLPFFHNFMTKKRKKKKKWRRISELSWGSNVEAILVGVAAFTANVIIIGFIAGLSIYYVEFKQAFSGNHGLISLSVFLPTGVFGSVGLLSGICLNKFGVRITALVGSLLLAIGVGACAFANNVIFLLAFLGAMAGTGCSLVYLSATMGVCAYFKHKGRLLMPLVTMGEAFGTIIFPPLTSYFIEMYYWRGSLVLMSGVMLQVTVCAMMYSIKNLHPLKDKGSDAKQRSNKSLLPTDGKKGNMHSSEALSDSGVATQNTSEPFNSDSTTARQSGKLPVEELNVSALIIPNPGEHSLLDPTPDSESEAKADLDSNLKTVETKVRQRDTFVSIISDKHYILFLISVFVISGCINTTLTVLPDFCVYHGLSLSESANIYAIGASGDAIARIIGGWLLFRNQLSSLVIFTVSGIVTGLLIAIYPLISTFYLICVLSFFVMLHSGLLFSVYSVVVLDFFDMNRYAIAIGLSETVAGFGVVLFGYLIGLITEYNNGSYVVSFYLISVMSVVCMLPMLILSLCKKKKVSVRIS